MRRSSDGRFGWRRTGDARGFPTSARGVLATLITAVVLTTASGTAPAVPPAPPNPDQDRIASERAEARSKAQRVGELANRLARTESRLTALTAKVERRLEAANKALVDLRRAERAYRRARSNAEYAEAQAAAAERQVERRRKQLDEFVSKSYQRGRKLGTVPAFVSAGNPREVLDRAMLLDVVSKSQLDVLDELRRAQTRKANKDSRARAALREAETKRVAAERARAAAEQARKAAIAARNAQRDKVRSIEAEKRRVEDALASARSQVSELESQRERYQRWLAEKRREERAQAAAAAAAQREAAEQSQSQGGGGSGSAAPASASSAVETVVQRALSQVGVTYAWGGGNAHGPTRGIRDGGVADAHGDYLKIGFDCSGLMLYAFAGVGIDLPHYSGYQYRSGTQVPVSQIQRGDMLFWNDGGSIHHVALYLGNGMMVEAPYSGAEVRVVPVRYDGMAPYAVRLL